MLPPCNRRITLYTGYTLLHATRVSAQTNAGGTRISGGAVAGIVIGIVVVIILLVLALVSPYSPWKRREQAEGAEEEANTEKGEGGGENPEGTPFGQPGMFGANGMQAGGGALGAQMPMGGGAMYPQGAGAQQAYMQPGYGAPETQRYGGNTAPYVPTFAAPPRARGGY